MVAKDRLIYALCVVVLLVSLGVPWVISALAVHYNVPHGNDLIDGAAGLLVGSVVCAVLMMGFSKIVIGHLERQVQKLKDNE